MSKAKGSPRKFAEKIALLNKKEAEATAEFEKIIKEVEETTRVTPILHYNQYPQQHQQLHHPSQPEYWPLPTRSSSFSNWDTSPTVYYQQQQQLNHHQPHHGAPRQQHPQAQLQPQQQVQQNFYVDQNGTQQQQQQQQQQSNRYPVHNTTSIHQHVDQNHRLHPIQQQQQQHQPIHEQSIRRQLTEGANNYMPVPNIAIFPIDDDYGYHNHQQQQQQQQQVSNTGSPTNHVDLMSHESNQNNISTNNGYIRENCSTSISSARSLPNIANLSVAGSPTCHSSVSPGTSQQRLEQPLIINTNNNYHASPLAPPRTTTTTNTTSTTLATSTTPTAGNLIEQHLHDNYDDTNSSFPSDQDFCSLPVQTTLHNIDHHHQQQQQQHQHHLNHQHLQTPSPEIQHHHQHQQIAAPSNPSWQPVVDPSQVGCASSAQTSPVVSEHHFSQQVGSMNGAPGGGQQSTLPVSHNYNSNCGSPQQQHSPQSLRPSTLGFSGAAMVRASSTNIINNSYGNNNDLLTVRPIHDYLSKSTEACHNYLPS